MKIVDGINQNGSLLGSCVDFLEAWLNLAEKLANSRAILYSPHAIPLPPTTHADEEQPMYHPLFNPLSFVIQAQKVRTVCYTVHVYLTFILKHIIKICLVCVSVLFVCIVLE